MASKLWPHYQKGHCHLKSHYKSTILNITRDPLTHCLGNSRNQDPEILTCRPGNSHIQDVFKPQCCCVLLASKDANTLGSARDGYSSFSTSLGHATPDITGMTSVARTMCWAVSLGLPLNFGWVFRPACDWLNKWNGTGHLKNSLPWPIKSNGFVKTNRGNRWRMNLGLGNMRVYKE